MKTNIRRLWIILLLLLPAGFVMGKTEKDSTFIPIKDTLTFKKSMATYSKSLTSIECGFIQMKSMRMLKEPNVSNGLFYFKNGDKVRWEYTQPFIYLIVINQGKVYIRDERKTKSFDITSNRTFSELNSKLGSLIDGSILEDQTDFLHQYLENAYLYKVVLTPRSPRMKKNFQRLTVFFEKGDLSVQRITLLEKNGDKTDIQFIDKKINKPLPDEKFIIR